MPCSWAPTSPPHSVPREADGPEGSGTQLIPPSPSHELGSVELRGDADMEERSPCCDGGEESDPKDGIDDDSVCGCCADNEVLTALESPSIRRNPETAPTTTSCLAPTEKASCCGTAGGGAVKIDVEKAICFDAREKRACYEVADGEKDSCCGGANTQKKPCCDEGVDTDDAPIAGCGTPPEKASCCAGTGSGAEEKADTCCGGCGGEDEDEKDSCYGANDEKDSCCCGRDDEKDTEKKSCCDEDESDKEEEDDDDSVCPCCIDVLVKHPDLDARALPRSSSTKTATASSLGDAAAATAQEHVRLLRACCAAFEQYCVRRACCFVSRPSQPPAGASRRLRPATRQQRQREETAKAKEKTDLPLPSVAAAPAAGEKLELEVRGMDCADCAPKVTRALARLPSVTPLDLDYFSGTAQLRYDPETISPEAIIKYVARATGFGIKTTTSTFKGGAAGLMTLPVLFSCMPSSSVLDEFDARPGSMRNIVELSFPIQGERAREPRDVLAQLQPFGAELIPAGVANAGRDMATRDLLDVSLRTIACAACCIPVLVLAWAKLPDRPHLYGGVSVGLTTAIQLIAYPILSSAMRTIVYLRQADMSVLVAVSTLTAYVFSIVAYAFEVSGKPFSDPFFETSSLLVTLIFLGRTIQAATRRATGSAIRELQKLQTTYVTLVSEDSAVQSSSQILDARLLYYGDIVRISPDTRIVTDGIVVSGSSDVDESSVTGESVAVPKQRGSRVMAGTLNMAGTLDIQVTQLVHENSISRITALVKQAQASRSPVQDLADKLSAIILPVAAASAAIAFLVWILVNRYVRDRSATSSSVDALTYAIAVLVVSCPCALGLAVPMVVSVAMRIGIREGVLFRSADMLQTAHSVSTVVFDKTGTLTQGLFSTERAEILVEGAEEIVRALVKENKHPISQGVLRYLDGRGALGTASSAVTDVVSFPGKGIKASLAGYPLLGGSATFTGASIHPLTQELLESGLTLFTVTLGGKPIALFGLADTPRPESAALVAELVRRSKAVMILSGDTPGAVQRLADAVGIPRAAAHGVCTPADKDAEITALQVAGRRVCFVGDGTNDGPALSRADVALAVAGGGSDVALTAAGAVLLGSDLQRGVLTLLDVASAARTHARAALAWCVIYNIFAILFASGALVGIRIEPRWAGLGEVVSVLPVVAIGFGLDARWAWMKMRAGTMAA